MGQEYTRTLDLQSTTPSTQGIILQDQFDNGENFDVQADGTDWTAEINQNNSYVGNSSLFLRTLQASAAANDIAMVKFFSHMSPTKVVTLDCYFNITTRANAKAITFIIAAINGVNNISAAIRYDPQNNIWQYTTDGTSYANITGSGQYLIQATWHHIRYRANFTTMLYEHFESDDLEIDISLLPLITGSALERTGLDIGIQLIAQGSSPPELFLDNLLITNF